jgi:hypothetical protein
MLLSITQRHWKKNQLYRCENLNARGVNWIFMVSKHSNSFINDQKFLNHLFRNLWYPISPLSLLSLCWALRLSRDVPADFLCHKAAVLGYAINETDVSLPHSIQTARYTPLRLLQVSTFYCFKVKWLFNWIMHRATRRIRDCPVSDLGPKTNSSDWSFSSFYSILPTECQESDLIYALTDLFQFIIQQ